MSRYYPQPVASWGDIAKMLAGFALFAAVMVASSPAHAEPFVPPEEYAFQALNAADAAETYSCLHRGTCVELNPLFGRHPSDAALLGGKAALGVSHFLVAHLLRNSPKAERAFETVSIVVQGGVVAANLRLVF